MPMPPTEPRQKSDTTLTLTCQITGRSFSYDPTLPLNLQSIPPELRFGHRPGAEDGEAGVWEVGE